MNSKLMLVGSTSALLVSFACGCAAEAGSDEEKTATEESAVVARDNGAGYTNPRDTNAHETNPRDAWERRTDDRGNDQVDYRPNPPGYNPPGYNPYRPAANPPGYNPPGRGYGYGRRYNPPGYNPPGYNPYAPAYNPPGYNPPGAW
jgi:hypothetical protein